MKGWIVRAFIIAVIVLIVQILIKATEGILGILIAFVIGFIFSGVVELISNGISSKEK